MVRSLAHVIEECDRVRDKGRESTLGEWCRCSVAHTFTCIRMACDVYTGKHKHTQMQTQGTFTHTHAHQIKYGGKHIVNVSKHLPERESEKERARRRDRGKGRKRVIIKAMASHSDFY